MRPAKLIFDGCQLLHFFISSIKHDLTNFIKPLPRFLSQWQL